MDIGIYFSKRPLKWQKLLICQPPYYSHSVVQFHRPLTMLGTFITDETTSLEEAHRATQYRLVLQHELLRSNDDNQIVRVSIDQAKGIDFMIERADTKTADPEKGWTYFAFEDALESKRSIFLVFEFLWKQSSFGDRVPKEPHWTIDEDAETQTEHETLLVDKKPPKGVSYASNARLWWNFAIGSWCCSSLIACGPKRSDFVDARENPTDLLKRYKSWFCSELVMSALLYADLAHPVACAHLVPCATTPDELLVFLKHKILVKTQENTHMKQHPVCTNCLWMCYTVKNDLHARRIHNGPFLVEKPFVPIAVHSSQTH